MHVISCSVDSFKILERLSLILDVIHEYVPIRALADTSFYSTKNISRLLYYNIPVSKLPISDDKLDL